MPRETVLTTNYAVLITYLSVHSLSNLILALALGYVSTLRNNVRSRAWGAAIGCSYRVERCCIVKVLKVER